MKKLISLMCAFLIAITTCTGVYALDNDDQATRYDDGYNPSLASIGLDYEEYMSMPETKRAFYSDFNVICVATNTKYLRVTDYIDNQLSNNETRTLEDNIVSDVVELSKEQFDSEIADFFSVENTSEMRTKMSVRTTSDSDTSTTSWITLTTYLSYGGNDKWALASDVTSLAMNGFLQPVTTHIIGLGVNSQFSVIVDSDYCSRTCTIYCQDPPIYVENYRYYYDTQYKGANGYAVYYNVVETEINNKVYFIVAIKPNNSAAIVVDGYGHYAKRSTSFVPSISISASGASMSISPSTSVVYMPNTHVQVDR